MSRPTAISPEEQEQIARRIGVLLLQSAPEGWQQMTVEYRATGEHHDLLGEVQLQDGSSQPWEPPEDLLGIFEHLREGMYRPDVGTWLSALYIVEHPSSYRIDINFDSEPRWRTPLPPSAYADELRRYPRADENIPDWMREKLDGSTGQPTATPASEATPPPAAEQPSVSVTTSPQAGPADASVPSAAPLTTAELERQTAAQQEPQARQVPPAPQSQSPQNPPQPQPDPGPSSDAEFRTAHAFDGYDDQGRPLVSSRPPVPSEEMGPLRQYLESAPQVLPSRGNAEDELDLERPALVPTAWHTDGVWVWQGAVPYYLAQYGVPPEPALIEHIRNRRFTLSEIDERTRDAVTNHLRGQLELPETSASTTAEQQTPQDEPADSAPAERGPEQDPLATPHASAPSGRDELDQPASDPSLGQTGPQPATSQPATSQPATAEPASSEPAQSAAEQGEDAGNVFARLHDKLGEHGVDGELYRIGSHSTEAHCLVQEGPDWVVTPGPADRAQGDVRFARPEQAAAYLLGTLLLNAPAEQAGQSADLAAAGAPEPSEPADSARPSSELSDASSSGAALSGSALSDSALSGSALSDSALSDSALSDSALSDSAPSDSARSEPAPSEPARSSEPSTTAGSPALSGDSGGLSDGASLPRRTPQAAAQDAGLPESADSAGAQPATAGSPAPEVSSASAAPLAAEAEDGVGTSRAESSSSSLPPLSGAESSSAEPSDPLPASDLPRRDAPGRSQPPQQVESPGGHFLFTESTASDQAPPERPSADAGQGEPLPGDSPTRMRPMPGTEQTGPPPAPQGGQPPQGQQPSPGPHGPAGVNGSAAANGTAGAGPLPQRQQRPSQGPGAIPPASGAAQQPPQAPNGQPQQPQQRPGQVPPTEQNGRPPQGPGAPQQQAQQQPQQQPMGQPPQQAQQQPQQQAQQQPQQQAQQIQPLSGEPPLTLYRDRHNVVLQPGTEVDRFGEPGGNVCYAIRTPYSHRSLPPQWANRTYRAYRVQRPMQALRGTAVPWFEQPGGGAAYVLPAAVSELIADGALVELGGNEAPRPPME